MTLRDLLNSVTSTASNAGRAVASTAGNFASHAYEAIPGGGVLNNYRTIAQSPQLQQQINTQAQRVSNAVTSNPIVRQIAATPIVSPAYTPPPLKPFVPTVGQFTQGRIVKPLVGAYQGAVNTFKPNQTIPQRVGSAVSTGMNIAQLTPEMMAANAGGFGVYEGAKAAIKAARTGGNPGQEFAAGYSGNRSVGAGEAVTDNPMIAGALNLGELPAMMLGGHAKAKIGEANVARSLQGISPNAFKIHPEDQKVLTDIIGKIQSGGKASPAELKDLQNLTEHYLGGKYVFAPTKKIAQAFDYVLAKQNGGIPGQLPKMGITGEPLSSEGTVTSQGVKTASLPTETEIKNRAEVNAGRPDLYTQRQTKLNPNMDIRSSEFPQNTGIREQRSNQPQLPELSSPFENASSTGTMPGEQRMGLPNSGQTLESRMTTPESRQPNGKNSYDQIISNGKKEIGRLKDEPGKTIKQLGDELYTQWVDRYNPITKVVKKVEDYSKSKGFMIRPEVNPKFQLRRFSGMGGIAEQRFNQELKPVLDDMTKAKIDKSDMDLYLKSRRDINLAQRGIYGSDAGVAQERIQALKAKYGDSLDQYAQKLYSYQSQGFKELADSGFFTPDVAKSIQDTNTDYVPFQRVMDQLDEYLGIPTKKLQQSANPISKIKGSDKQIYSPIESIIANTFKQRAAIEKNNVAKSIVGLQNVMPDLGFQKVAKSADDTIAVWENGQKAFYKVGKDIADTVKGMNEEQMNTFLKVLTVPASVLRQGATGRNPEFMLPNMIRDQFDAALNAKYGYVPVVDYIRGLSHLVKEDFGGGDALYKEWVNSGGSQSFGDLSGRKSIQNMFDDANQKKKLFGWLSDTLDTMGRYSETPTRLGLYARAKKVTGNTAIAAYESREGTMDFSRMGSKMKVANSLIPFLNVGIQGSNKIVRNLKENPGQFALKAGIYGIAPSLLTTLYNVTAYPQEYKEIPQYVKDSNFVIVTGRNKDGTVDYVTIPKGNVINYIANPVENFISYLANTNQESVKQMATQFLSSALPVIGDGTSLKEIGIKTIGENLPQAIKPITENLVNRSFYKYDPNKEQAKDIVPTYFNTKPPAERAYDFTPVMYKKIGAILNVSPLQVQNVMEGYLAAGAKVPAQIIENMSKLGNNEGVDQNQVPILRRFIQHTYPDSSQQITNNNERVGLFQNANASSGGDAQQGTVIKYKAPDNTNKTIDLTPPTKGQGIDAFSNQNWMYSKARAVYSAPISDSMKQEAYKKLGVDAKEVEYDYKATKSNDIKSQYAISQAKSLTHDQLIERLVSGRIDSVSGEKFASNGVIDAVAAKGLITDTEAKQLKKIDLDKSGKPKATKAKGGSNKFKSFKVAAVKRAAPSPIKIKSPQAVKLDSFKIAAPGTVKIKGPHVKKNPLFAT